MILWPRLHKQTCCLPFKDSWPLKILEHNEPYFVTMPCVLLPCTFTIYKTRGLQPAGPKGSTCGPQKDLGTDFSQAAASHPPELESKKLPKKNGVAAPERRIYIPPYFWMNLHPHERPFWEKKHHRTSAHLVTHIEVASNTSNREHHQLERCRNRCLGSHQGPSQNQHESKTLTLSFLAYALGICMGSRISAMISWKKHK